MSTSIEKQSNNHNDTLDRQFTAGGHENDRSQPPLPVARFLPSIQIPLYMPQPIPSSKYGKWDSMLGPKSWKDSANCNGTKTDIFLISVYGLHARGIQSPNVMVGMLVFFGGVCQFLAGIMEFVTGNTFGATVFTSYGAFNLSYAMIYLPGSGIIAAYTDATTGLPGQEFNEAVAIYLWVWLIVTVIYTVAAMRSTWILFLDLVALDICLLLLAVGFMTGVQGVLTAGLGWDGGTVGWDYAD
ncbi:acetate uptake transporter family protein [Aspergillus stella-maris]|uniref:acetate uptake transporter family protein n=1 Tax=Aspergillus stella-maris TaxID=1810926 RepID=UPI003CCE13F3